MYLYILLIVVVSVSGNINKCDKKNVNVPDSVKIKEKLFCDYDKVSRPVLKDEPLVLSLHFIVIHVDYFEYKNTLNLKGWGVAKWRDEHIYWVPEENNNITTIFVPPEDIWSPDLVVLNAKNKFSSNLMKSTLCVAHYRKLVFCAYPLRIRAKCKADFTYWPFDTHNCTIRVESLFHEGDKLDFNDSETSVSELGKGQSSAWEIVEENVVKLTGENYPSLYFNFVMKRHSFISVAIVLIPYIVLCSMTILAVWLNAFSPERIYISAFNLTWHVYYLLNTTWELPLHTDSVPKLMLLLRNSQFLATFVLIETMVTRHVLMKSNRAPGWCVKILYTFTNTTFGKIFFYSELYSNDMDDGENLVDDKSKVNDWKMLGIFLDRFVFYFIIVVYVAMFIDCIPK